jgi:hypothetical protein
MTALIVQKPELVERLEQLAIDRDTTPDALLDTAVQEFLDKVDHQAVATRPERPAAPPEFLREIAAFERLKPELLKQYKGRVVAIYRGDVVAVGDDKMSVHDAVLEKFGSVPCYIEWVEEVTPRRARIVSVWRAR